jgi:hypothetical protein
MPSAIWTPKPGKKRRSPQTPNLFYGDFGDPLVKLMKEAGYGSLLDDRQQLAKNFPYLFYPKWWKMSPTERAIRWPKSVVGQPRW